jgi:hypothetical protein
VVAGEIAGSNPTALTTSRDAFLAGDHEAAQAYQEGCTAVREIGALHEQAKSDLDIAGMGVRVLEAEVQLLSVGGSRRRH